uniref:AAA+ ATPase domain-containing protein n=1 Tax=Oryza barthii TaxID=65489 RepID=A0A0D3GRB8_9ORYZ
MAEAIVGPLVGRLQELALGQARALVGVNADIQKLKDKLMWLQAFLREADAKRRAVSDEVTKVWVLQTRDAVFDAEDALDHYYLQLDKSRYPMWICPTAKLVTTFTTQAHIRHKLSRKIKAINSRLEDIIENKHKYKIEEANTKTTGTWKASTSISYTHKKLEYLHESDVPIHVEERKKLEKVLLTTPEDLHGKEHNPVIISVFGKSGVGKTTLVRKIFKEIGKQKQFDIQAMECFAPYLSATNILQQIVQQLTKDNKNCPRNMVLKMLEEELKEQKYLLVIDGEVSGTELNNILSTLPIGHAGSRIVHITESKPEEPPSNYHHVTIELKTIDKSISKKMFLHHMEITGGLPLAIALLSGLMKTKESPGEWQKVFEYLKSKQSKQIDDMLSICCDDLPHELKCCFLYLAAFPANVTIEARSLVSMWVAEGFLRSKVGKSMEDIGYFYLKELSARNLVSLVQMDDDSNVSNMTVTIQNKVHEFLQFEAHEASFLEVHSGDDIPTLTSARRLSLQNYTDKYAVLANPLPKLRSIFSQFEQEPKEELETMTKSIQAYVCCSPQQGTIASMQKKNIKSHIKELLHGSEFLRVINIQGIEIGNRLTRAIGKAVHLQYLGITSCSLENIPSSIGNLTSLQTLDVRETNVRKLPKAFWMIKTLRHVFGFILKLPKQTVNLKQLHTLDSIELEDFEQGLDNTLGEMIHLEGLVIWNISNGNVEALLSALRKLESLKTLNLQGNNITSSVFTTLFLRRLKFMVLDGELDFSSDQLNNGLALPNLTMLTLRETKVTQEFINKLAKLPSLVTLALCLGSYKDQELVFFSNKFRCLKKLKVDVEKLKKVEIKLSMLPKLKKLEIRTHDSHHYQEHEVTHQEHEQKTVISWKKENAIQVE